MVENPILRGMNPDPSICTDGINYYIATSTFEYFPGLKIYQSEDLANWKLVGRPLTKKQINLRGIPDSAGVWAPSIRYFDQKFYLTYSVMHNIDGVYKDLKNYLVTADKADGNWSQPIYIGSQGFDPSLFKDDDGSYYVVSQNWDYRRTYTHQAFNGIILQRYEALKKKIIGNEIVIWRGTPQGGTEGPSIFKRNGYYYLLTANGGSGRHHSISIARSDSIVGPYKLAPQVNLITSFNVPEENMQKSGHGNLVETSTGETYLVHLVARYLPKTEISVLGRETAIEKVIWQNDWPILSGNTNSPQSKVFSLPENHSNVNYETNFENGLDLSWSSLRQSSKYKINKSGLKLYGNESLSSLFEQALITKPWPSVNINVSTDVSFEPRDFRDQAGLVLYYNTKNWVFLYTSYDELAKRQIVNLQISHNGQITEPANGLYFYLTSSDHIQLTFKVRNAIADSYVNGKEYGRHLDVSFLSDEKIEGWGFTGAVTGITVIDTKLKSNFAIFHNFKITEVPDEVEK